MTVNEERPKLINAREVPVHREGDFIMGKNHKPALCVIVERKTRFVQIDYLEKNDAKSLRRAIEKHFRRLTPQLRRSLTLEQGKENTQQEILTESLCLDVYYCNPSSALVSL